MTASPASQDPNLPPGLSEFPDKGFKEVCVTGAEAPSAYLHLPAGHEVGTLTDALEDLLQLGVDEGIIWRNVGPFQNRALSVPPTITAFCRVHSP